MRRREQEAAALDMEEQLAARRRVAAELQAQLQARAETMAARTQPPLEFFWLRSTTLTPTVHACLEPQVTQGVEQTLGLAA